MRPPRRHDFFPSDFVRVVGSDLLARTEDHPNPDYVDHVWISLDAGVRERIIISVNTTSRRNREEGFDDRIRVGVIRSEWKILPPRGINASKGLDYARCEDGSNVYYEHLQRPDLESLLITATHRSILGEAWGEPYWQHNRPGLHQIHSRRGSCAVPVDIKNRDGALRFYYEDKTSEMFLLKFCGQP